MTKPKKEDVPQADDLEAFEEWEGDDTERSAEAPLEEGGPQGADDELDFLSLDEKETDPALKAGAPAAAPAEEEPEDAAQQFAESLLELAPDMPVNLVAVIGKMQMSVGDLMKCRLGQVLDLGRPPGETVDVVANGRLIARGELVDMDGQLGVRILKMVK
jgi:flagellar motor switch protein FliN/FliY